MNGQINALGGHAGDIGTTTDRVFAMAEAVRWEGEKRRREKAEKEKKELRDKIATLKAQVE